MKYLYPAALLLLLMVSCQKDEKVKKLDREKTDWAFYHLKGNVKSISEKSTPADARFTSKYENMSEHDKDITFNDEGMLIAEKKWMDASTPFEEFKYNGREKIVEQKQYMSGKPSIITVHTRDKNGNTTSIIRRNPDNTQIDRIAMKYSNGKLSEKTTYNIQDLPVQKIKYLYDAKGNLTEESLLLQNEMVTYKTTYEYDGDKKKSAELKYDKDGKLMYKTSYAYNGDHLAKSATTDADGTINVSEKIEHDKKGNILTFTTFEKFGNSETTDKYTYDDKGNKTSWTVLKDNNPIMKVAYSYDKFNNLTGLQSEDNNGTPDSRSYTFEYDKAGNWIKRTTVINGTPAFIAERKITYFE